MRPLRWTELRDVCESAGWTFSRQKGDHYIMTKPDEARPVVIPTKKSLKEDIVLTVARTIGMNKKTLLEKLNDPKGKNTQTPGT